MSEEGLQEIIELQSVLDTLLSDRQSLKVLEAGCGSASYVKIGKNPYIVGIDISEKQLARNSILNEKILGDIQTYNLANSEFDVIVCCYVLEHIPKPELAMENFRRSIQEDGIIVLALPDPLSVWGVITKYTPLWIHTWVYKYIFGDKNAGQDDVGPFPTFLKPSITPAAIQKFAHEQGLSVEYINLYENFRQKGLRKKMKIEGYLWNFIQGIIKFLTLGKIDGGHTDYIIVLKKPKTNNKYSP